jgi:competence/damage-inducible protein CinA-like protein
MAKAEIIAIGSELLLGETQDTNTFYLLKELRGMGIDVFRTTMIGDNPARIAQVIKEALERADIIITTGGLGPTIDDPTRDAVALAFDTVTVFKEELWADISNYFAKMGRSSTENNKRQAYIPACAEPLANPVGTAPAFYVAKNGKLVLSLPGVPSEMKYIFSNGAKAVFETLYPSKEIIIVRTLHTYGLGESVIDEMVGELETSANPTLGLSAKQGQIDLRLTAKGSSLENTQQALDQFEISIRQLLGNAIFGSESDTLYSVVNGLLKSKGIQLSITETGTDGLITRAFDPELIKSEKPFIGAAPSQATNIDQKDSESERALFHLSVKIEPTKEGFDHLQIFLKTHWKDYQSERFYNSLTFSKEQSVLSTLNLVRTAIIEQ